MSTAIMVNECGVSSLVMAAAAEWNAERRSKTRRKRKKSQRAQRERSVSEPIATMAGAKKTLSSSLRNSDGGWIAIEHLTTPETNPEYFTIRAADCYRHYVRACNDYGLNKMGRLSKRAFSMLAQEYVRAFKGRDGYHWYEMNNISNVAASHALAA